MKPLCYFLLNHAALLSQCSLSIHFFLVLFDTMSKCAVCLGSSGQTFADKDNDYVPESETLWAKSGR